jgi:hypothetical protein
MLSLIFWQLVRIEEVKLEQIQEHGLAPQCKGNFCSLNQVTEQARSINGLSVWQLNFDDQAISRNLTLFILVV